MASERTPVILMVDDDPLMVQLVQAMLEPHGYAFHYAESLFRADGLIQRHAPDLIILDRDLPDGDGLALLKSLRAGDRAQPPVLILSGRGSPRQKAQGLDEGADDYLPKPFTAVELQARVRALLRRRQGSAAAPPTRMELEGLVLDGDARSVRLEDKPLNLPAREFELLAVFLEKPGRVLDRRYLLERVWGEGASLRLGSKSVDVAVGRLRKALGAWGSRLTTVESAGYRLDA